MNKLEVCKIKLPKFITKDCWVGFVEMRYSIKKPLTKRACELIFKKLEASQAVANEILDQSTMNCWIGIFPLKDEFDRKDW